MRLANGIVLDKEKTFGVLKFSALRHEVRVENEDGTTTEEIKRRTYDLKCSQQERTIQVSAGTHDTGIYPSGNPCQGLSVQCRGGAYQSCCRYRGKRQLPRGRRGMVHQGRRHCAEE